MNKSLPRFEYVYNRVPRGERRLPICVVRDKNYTWDEVMIELMKGTELGARMLEFLTDTKIIHTEEEFAEMIEEEEQHRQEEDQRKAEAEEQMRREEEEERQRDREEEERRAYQEGG